MKIRCAHCGELVEPSPRQLSCLRTGRTFAVASADSWAAEAAAAAGARGSYTGRCELHLRIGVRKRDLRRLTTALVRMRPRMSGSDLGAAFGRGTFAEVAAKVRKASSRAARNSVFSVVVTVF